MPGAAAATVTTSTEGGAASRLAPLLALVCLVGAASGRAQVGPVRPQSVEAGSRVFLNKGCIECHAVNRLGGTVGPDLARTSGYRSPYDLAAALWNHIPDMRRAMAQRRLERPRLATWEAGDLMAFLFWLGYFDEPGDTLRGARLFRQRQCVACHQVRGAGGVMGPDLGVVSSSATPIMLAAGMWNHAPAMARAMQSRQVPRPVFTGSELRDLLAFVKGSGDALPSGVLYVAPGHPERGRQLFQEKRCVECHRVAGTGGRVGPDLGAQRRYATVLDFAAAMWNKGPAMLEAMGSRGLSLPALRADEMADLVAYLYEGRYFGTAGVAARGEQVALTHGCERCHARDLPRLRGLVTSTGVVAALWNHLTVPMPGAGGWPRLDAQSVADLTAYFEGRGN
ncbi:MAG TPA: c-type cytochrome [Gemmatimonadales bacterium]|nr:c-type cytochrome [Gemmatimonadales bacterium]